MWQLMIILVQALAEDLKTQTHHITTITLIRHFKFQFLKILQEISTICLITNKLMRENSNSLLRESVLPVLQQYYSTHLDYKVNSTTPHVG